jgi:5-methylcytosine-specific restriction protein A
MDRALQQLVRERAQECCEYCQLPQRATILPHQIDHVIAQKHYGATEAGLR